MGIKTSRRSDCKNILLYKLMFCTFALLLILPIISAAQWDNIKKYDPDRREVTIENALGLGGDVATIRLISPLNFQVARGYGKVAEFELTYYKDNNGGLDLIKFFNVKNQMNKIDREFDYKIKEIEEVAIDDYEYINCKDFIEHDGSILQECDVKITGSHMEERVVWNDFNKNDLKKQEKVTIGIFTNVQKGDMVEWIPTFYGVEIKEWAVWVESLSADLVSYYKFDDIDNASVIDTYGLNNGTQEGGLTDDQTGVIKKCFDFNTTTSDFVSTGATFTSTFKSPFSISLWYKPDDGQPADWDAILGVAPNADHNIYLKHGTDGTIEFKYKESANAVHAKTSSAVLSNGVETWHHIVIIVNGTNILIYFDGSEETLATSPYNGSQLGQTMGDYTNAGTSLYIGGDNDGGLNRPINGNIDEVGIWNRSLNASEISDLWNSGSGLEHSSEFVLPIITVASPIGVIDYGLIGSGILDVIFTDANLDTCWYNYNGTNTTINGCLNGTANSTSFVLEQDNFNMTIYANDTSGNLNSTSINWTYKILDIRTHNTTAYGTGYETYSINVTANASLTAVNLLFNGTSFVMTNAGSGIWTYSRDLPISTIGNNSINLSFTYGAETLYANSLTYQYVNYTTFALCNSSLTDSYLNISFQNEDDSSIINATIPTSTFIYYLGSGTVSKSYQLINNTLNFNYEFCATPNRTFYVDPTISYASTGYPQRIWNPAMTSYTSAGNNETLYLLDSGDGIYVTFQLTNPSNQVLSNVTVVVEREIAGTTTTIGQGTTGTDGTITFWLNPDFSHTITASKSGFTTTVSTITPTQSTYTIVLGGVSTQQIADYSQGIGITIRPPITATLYNNTNYNFNITITTSYWDLDAFGIFLKLRNGTILNSGSSTSSSGGIVNLVQNTSNYEAIGIGYWYTVNGTNMTADHWLIIEVDDSGFSIKTFFSDLNNYIDSGIFGLDEFGKTLLIFITLFIFMGIMSYKYGFTSPMAISFIAFLSIYLFDVVLGLLTSPVDAIPNMYTWLIGIVTAVMVIKEVTSR